MHNQPPKEGETFLGEFMGDMVVYFIASVSKLQPKAPRQYHIVDQFKDERWIEHNPKGWIEAKKIIDDRIIVAPGLYRHYKGNLYRVTGMAYDTEREEDVVVYLPCYPCVHQQFTVSAKKFTSLVRGENQMPLRRFTECTTTE